MWCAAKWNRLALSMTASRKSCATRRIRARPMSSIRPFAATPISSSCASASPRPEKRRPLIFVSWPGAAGFDVAAPCLVLKPLLLFRARHLGLVARLWPMRRALHQIKETRERLGAITLLRAVTVGADHDHPLQSQPPPRQPSEPRLNVRRKRGMPIQLEPQFHRSRHLVDVLPAGPGGAHEALLDVALVERQRRGDWNHCR